MYEELRGTWQTPKGNPATFTYRADTSDWNTVQSCVQEDEYGLRELSLSGWALDLGAHIGGVAVGLLLDNPELRVIAVEPVPRNVDLLRRNLYDNGVADRAIVIEGAVGAPGMKRVRIAWGHIGTELAEHHAFIGNQGLATEVPHEVATVGAWSLDALLRTAGTSEFVLAKLDTEGGEKPFLRCPHLEQVREWVGEWHPPDMTAEGVHRALGATHDVETWGEGPGGFRAMRR